MLIFCSVIGHFSFLKPPSINPCRVFLCHGEVSSRVARVIGAEIEMSELLAFFQSRRKGLDVSENSNHVHEISKAADDAVC